MLTTYKHYVKVERSSYETGKTYYTWSFIGWSEIPNMSNVDIKLYGKYLKYENSLGVEYRYDLSTARTTK